MMSKETSGDLSGIYSRLVRYIRKSQMLSVWLPPLLTDPYPGHSSDSTDAQQPN